MDQIITEKLVEEAKRQNKKRLYMMLETMAYDKAVCKGDVKRTQEVAGNGAAGGGSVVSGEISRK